jgi:hypothetical protein
MGLNLNLRLFESENKFIEFVPITLLLHCETQEFEPWFEQRTLCHAGIMWGM